MKRTTIQQIYPKILFLSILFNLSACGGYGSSFACKDASGFSCMPLSLVDHKINSGEIAEVELKERTKCKGRNCYAKSLIEKPDIKVGKIHRIKLQNENDQRKQEFKDDNVLYIK